MGAGEAIETKWDPDAADVLFLAGMDWLAVPERCTTPVVNLVQGIRHADAADPRSGFLPRPAVRICVSQPVTDAVLATGRANGPVITIPAGLDTDSFPKPAIYRDIPLLISGPKQPALAKELHQNLLRQGVASLCLTTALPRTDYLNLLARALVTVFLPLRHEGFYLPALEGMAMGSLVVCPDCVGNREFCVDGVNCLMPEYEPAALLEASIRSLAMEQPQRYEILESAKSKAAQHALRNERQKFLKVLSEMCVGGL